METPTKPAFKINIDAYTSDDLMFAIAAAVIRDTDFKWFLGITCRIISPCMLEIQLGTLREILLQAWACQIDLLEIDLFKEVWEELQVGPLHCRSYLRTLVPELTELLNKTWQVHLQYAQRPVNSVAAVLAYLCKEQRDVLVIHVEPPQSLCTALELDHETYYYAQQLEANVLDHSDTAPA